MTLNEIISLRGMISARKNEVIDIDLALKLLRFKKATEAEEELFTARQKALLDECAERDSEGRYIFDSNGGVKLTAEGAKKWREGMEKLNNAESAAELRITREELQQLRPSLEEMEILTGVTEVGDGWIDS